MHLSYGDYPAREYLKHITSFRGLRVYDIAKFIGADTTMPDDLVQGLWDEIAPDAEQWRQMGVFGAGRRGPRERAAAGPVCWASRGATRADDAEAAGAAMWNLWATDSTTLSETCGGRASALRERGHMAFVLIEHLVGDFETFKQVYLDDGERRRMSGSKGGNGVSRCRRSEQRHHRPRVGRRGAGARVGRVSGAGAGHASAHRATSPRRESPCSSTRWTRRSSARRGRPAPARSAAPSASPAPAGRPPHARVAGSSSPRPSRSLHRQPLSLKPSPHLPIQKDGATGGV